MKKILSKPKYIPFTCSCGNKLTAKSVMVKEDGHYGWDTFIPRCSCGKYYDYKNFKIVELCGDFTKK